MYSCIKRDLSFISLICVLIIPFVLTGCAGIDPFEAPAEVMRNPLGKESIKIGMSKEEVISKWGEPDLINAEISKDASANKNEEWIYKARRYTPVPIDSGYLHKNKYLYFDGNNLVAIKDEPRKAGF